MYCTYSYTHKYTYSVYTYISFLICLTTTKKKSRRYEPWKHLGHVVSTPSTWWTESKIVTVYLVIAKKIRKKNTATFLNILIVLEIFRIWYAIYHNSNLPYFEGGLAFCLFGGDRAHYGVCKRQFGCVLLIIPRPIEPLPQSRGKRG